MFVLKLNPVHLINQSYYYEAPALKELISNSKICRLLSFMVLDIDLKFCLLNILRNFSLTDIKLKYMYIKVHVH